jgi:hypothetical protein
MKHGAAIGIVDVKVFRKVTNTSGISISVISKSHVLSKHATTLALF